MMTNLVFLLLSLGVSPSVPNTPHLGLDEWWGPRPVRKSDSSIRPFKIEFREKMIDDLRYRLKNHRSWNPPLEGTAFYNGFNTDKLDDWLYYWAELYDFKERENFLNQFPQYKTNVQGLNMHFIWVKPKVPADVEVVPMLFLHGWPGSVREFYEAIPLLTSVSGRRNFTLEVIVPSLPGAGYSDAAVRPGLGAAEMAVVFRNLMRRLGHQRFYVQGGDWGSIIGGFIATLFPKEVLGYHSNLALSLSPKALLLDLLGSQYPPLVVSPELEDRMYPLLDKLINVGLEETGYFHEQATKPDTLGIGFTDSPAALLAYIFEKFSTATDLRNVALEDGGLHNDFSTDQLIDNLMFYWAPNKATSAMRIYSETSKNFQREYSIFIKPTPVPYWAIQAKHEIIYQSPPLLRSKYPNLFNTTVLDYGGHFLALQYPTVFSEDVLNAVGEFRRSKSFH